MTWTYDPTNLGTTTADKQLDTVRFLIGDTDTNDQQVSDEEIAFALEETGTNVYLAASWVSRAIASKYARQVTLNLDDQISAEYGELHKHYLRLAKELSFQGKKSKSMGIKAGGISKTTMKSVVSLTDRVEPRITRDQFNNPPDEYQGDD